MTGRTGTSVGFPKGSFDVGGGGGLLGAVLRWVLIFQVALGVPRLIGGVFIHYGPIAGVPAAVAAVAGAGWCWSRTPQPGH